jgi:hypothetical protein
MWRRGWCRNARLYAPQQSHLVDQDSLDCSRGLGSSWEPAESELIREDRPHRQPLRLFAPQPQFALAGGMMMASSGLGDGGSGSGESRNPLVGPPRPERPNPTAGQERTVSYQPEERYWTDYLRIALPVMGLLLLIGVFWYWAAALIGDSNDHPPPTAEVALGEVREVNASPPAQGPTPTVPPVAANSGPPPTSAPSGAANPSPTPAQAAPAATTSPAQTTQQAGAQAGSKDFPTYNVGDSVVTTDDVRMRDQPSTDASVVAQMPNGTPLKITGEFANKPAPELDWWPVTDPASGQSGFIREDFLKPQ